MKEISSSKCFGGFQKLFIHYSDELRCPMNVGVFVPSQAQDNRVPVLYFLSGYKSTEENFLTKTGYQKFAAEYGILVVAPDTIPRRCAAVVDPSLGFGSDIGFYVDATQDKWEHNYRMYSYITKELQNLINNNFPVVPRKQAVCGYSMGGHGALMCALKNPGMFTSVSVFAPLTNPTNSSWGQKVSRTYLGDNIDDWKEYDATHLIGKYEGPPLDILIDQGSEDEYLKTDLLPENFIKAATNQRLTVTYRLHSGYDHSYYFLSTFMEDHFKHHAMSLKKHHY